MKNFFLFSLLFVFSFKLFGQHASGQAQQVISIKLMPVTVIDASSFTNSHNYEKYSEDEIPSDQISKIRYAIKKQTIDKIIYTDNNLQKPISQKKESVHQKKQETEIIYTASSL